MEPSEDLVPGLRAQIASLESILADLKTELSRVENYYKNTAPSRADSDRHSRFQANSSSSPHLVNYNGKTFENLVDQLDLSTEEKCGQSWELTAGEYKRYGRQLIMPEIGLGGGPSSLNYSVRLLLTQSGNRTATTQECLGPDRRCWRPRMSSCHISCRCRSGKDWPCGW